MFIIALGLSTTFALICLGFLEIVATYQKIKRKTRNYYKIKKENTVSRKVLVPHLSVVR